MTALFVIDGAAFVLVGLIVLATPSPQPALVRRVDESIALPPFKDTRRLLASQFVGNGLLALAVGLMAPGGPTERAVAFARLATIAIVLVINAFQLRGDFWKRPPLYVITVTLSAIAVGYLRLLLR